MGEQPSGLVALCGFRLSIIASKAIPAVIIEMGQANSVHIDGIQLGVWSTLYRTDFRGLSNTVDMIRVDRVNCLVDFCISLRGLRNFLACLVGKGLRVKLVESYESYEWRKRLST